MRRFSTSITLVLTASILVSICSAQQTATSAVPNLIRYSGTLKDVQVATPAGTAVGVIFAIYKQQDGGAPVWQETQNVMPDASGQYSVLLGSTTAAGLPGDLFTQQEQRWLEVRVQGEAEQARVLLVSVPYALKAGDAETFGGRPPSAFLSAPVSGEISAVIGSGTAQDVNSDHPLTLTGSGTTNYVPLWTNASNLTSSVIYQNPSSNIGIGTTAPAAKLDVNGGINTTDINAAKAYGIGGSNVLSIGSAADANLFLGVGAGTHNTAGQGQNNAFSGYQAGFSNTTGHSNTFSGSQAGIDNTLGSNNSFFGSQAGLNNSTGGGNTFFGASAGTHNSTGQNNIYIGNQAGFATQSGSSSNIYIGSQGGAESNTIRIGDPTIQTAAYMAGIYGNALSGGSPVVVNASGQLGTGTSGGSGVTSWNGRTGAVVPVSGDYSFSLLSGTLASSQLSGAYSNAVTLSNTSNVYYGNGSNLTGVGAGAVFVNTNYPIVNLPTQAGQQVALGAISLPAGAFNLLNLSFDIWAAITWVGYVGGTFQPNLYLCDTSTCSGQLNAVLGYAPQAQGPNPEPAGINVRASYAMSTAGTSASAVGTEAVQVDSGGAGSSAPIYSYSNLQSQQFDSTQPLYFVVIFYMDSLGTKYGTPTAQINVLRLIIAN